PDGSALAGPLLFTTTTTPGLAMDGLFYWTAKGLNWDAYGHNPASSDAAATLPCTPDSNGYNTRAPTAINYFEWCQDHNKPMQAAPFGDVAGGGPVTLPDANIFANGAWFGGSPYLGPNATRRATGPPGTTPPSGTIANSPTGQAGFAFMWSSATATLPDGSAVPMWGYSCGAPVAGATCAKLNPAAAAGVWSPVVITVPPGPLTISLTNSLPNSVPTSLVIVGQLGGGLGTTATS